MHVGLKAHKNLKTENKIVSIGGINFQIVAKAVHKMLYKI